MSQHGGRGIAVLATAMGWIAWTAVNPGLARPYAQGFVNTVTAAPQPGRP